MKKKLGILIFLYLLLSCNKSPNQSSINDNILFFEIKRKTDGLKLEGKHAFVNIDFGAYMIDADKIHIFFTSNNLTENTKLICGVERSLSGDVGGGKAGSINFCQDFPIAIEIMKYPLESKPDTLTILNNKKSGEIQFIFNSIEYKCDVGTTIIETTNGQMQTATGKFMIADTIKFINHGFKSKKNIIIH